MRNRIFAILPEAAVEWEKRRISAMMKLPSAEISETKKKEILDYMDESREFIKQYFGMMYNQRRDMVIDEGVGIIHINDYLGGDLTFFDRCLGASDYGDIAKDIQAARSNPDVKAVHLDVDSGGGSASGCVEVGRLLAELSAEKETAFFSNSYCCSAAYAIAVAAKRRYASPSSMIGSIGTILTWFDYEKMLDEEGIRPHQITSTGADLKQAATPYRAPTDAEAEHLQASADEYGSQFVDFVWSQNKGIDMEQGFRGQGVSGREAVEIGFIDAVTTRDAVLAELKSWAAVS